MRKKVCFVTGTRAEYGLLLPLMKAIEAESDFELQLLVTGMHLSPEFGLTYKLIEADGLKIDAKVDMLLSSDTAVGISKSVGIGIIGYTDAFAALNPDYVVILGDRFEAFAAASAAYIAQFPIIHISGGETTEGATDEAFRHAITKMAYWHFTATEVYRKRVIQLGEDPARVFNVGAIGIDNIKKMERFSQQELEASLSIDLSRPTVLVTYHPVTLEKNTSRSQFQEIINALLHFKDLQVVITYPNADADGRVVIEMIQDTVKQYPDKFFAFQSLGQKRYLSLIPYVKAVIGNSSSGIVEIPSFHIPTVNIGDRQKGRIAADSVLHVNPTSADIIKGMEIAFSGEFMQKCKEIENPYGNGNTTEQMMKVFAGFTQIKNIQKQFYDL
ncbi:MAG: UDP-N-acetylglucosamine 2-epimerase (hydrolyzing) [Chitinophaga sp.]|uniref:UDP-N-acetylglucosamine 2-epimerase n=1 Tax=Chitinophaga sp. TaxID=1869181 RepID=UPI001B09F86C|nr:UDP-N-acetylglucosamine 2-epimerase [Chitinophaga sp.]MBO9731729.1 UDP-N-acetylglucosamine 2-epimerase (hydrolyzing) [Chitinophaga sp.]